MKILTKFQLTPEEYRTLDSAKDLLEAIFNELNSKNITNKSIEKLHRDCDNAIEILYEILDNEHIEVE